MSLVTYESARPWAKAIKAAVMARKMPPWFAEGAHFTKQRPKMMQSDIDTIVAWVNGGAVEGDAKDKPEPLKWDEHGWTIRPDLVFELPITYNVPAKATIPWMDYRIPFKVEKDIYVAAGEMLPDAYPVVHHVDIDIVPPSPETKWMDDWDPTKELPADKARMPGRFIAIGWSPGENPQRYDMDDSCMLIPAGSHLVFNIHYNTNGTPMKDRSKGAFELCKKASKNIVHSVREAGGETLDAAKDDTKTIIPAGAAYFPGHREITFAKDVELAYVQPHMHLRGKDFKYTLTYPTGEKEELLWVPRYDYSWQIVYYPDTPLRIPAGSKLDMDGHWDNSANNRFNPDPTADVKMGLQAWEEMFSGIVYVIIPRDMDPDSIAGKRSKNSDSWRDLPGAKNAAATPN